MNKHRDIFEQGVCRINGCTKKQRSKGLHTDGRRRYDRVCGIHHKTKSGSALSIAYQERVKIDNSVCELCGWDKAPCDRHRKNPNKGYVRENVEVICPNCHRERHYQSNAL